MPHPLYADDPVKNRLFNTYRNIRQNVFNPNNPTYQANQRDGVEVELDWDTFADFYDWVMFKLGPPPFPGARIVRKDQHKGWTRRNLEWNTHRVQGLRLRRCTLIKLGRKTKTLIEWCEELGLSYWTVFARKQRGITDPKLLLAQPYKV